jgi:hypothetical protein
MHCLILSSGPSLPQMLPLIERVYDGCVMDKAMVIGVNFAANHHAVHWQVAGDSLTWEALQARPWVGICAPGTILENTARGDYDHPPVGFTGLQTVNWNALRLANTPTECNYSIIAAIALAIDLGATGDLPIYGADMNDAPDCAGRANVSRDPARWARELADLETVSQHAAVRGITVSRILPSGVYPVIADMNRARKPGRPPAAEARPMPTDEPIVTAVRVVPARLKCRRCATEYDAKVYERRGAGMALACCRCPRCGQVDRMPRLANQQ